MQHHQMSPVDQPEPFDMVILGPVEKRRQHRLLVDRIGKDGRVVEHACSSSALAFEPGQHDAADDVALEEEEDDQGREASRSLAPVMIISHWMDCSTAKLESPTGSV